MYTRQEISLIVESIYTRKEEVKRLIKYITDPELKTSYEGTLTELEKLYEKTWDNYSKIIKS